MLALVLAALVSAAPASMGDAPASVSDAAAVPEAATAPVVDAAPPEAGAAPPEAGTAPTEAGAAPTEAATAPTDDATAPTEAAAAPKPDAGACLALVKAGRRDEAKRCYVARGEPAVAALVDELRPREPTSAPPQTDWLGPKAELVAVSTLTGAGVGLAEGYGAVVLTNTTGVVGAGAVLLAPVVGGVVGLAGSTAAVIFVPQMTAGDANLVRSFELVGAFNGIMLPFESTAAPGFLAVGGGLIVVGTTALGSALASVSDLPESAGSFALSTGLWGTVAVVLVADMASAFKQNPNRAVWLVAAAGNTGFAAGLVAAPFIPMTRAETWAVDVGGGVGLAAGAAVAAFTRAPNPFVGWGTILVGTGAGIATGFAAARYTPGLVDNLPHIVAVAPLAIPDGRAVVLGGSVVGRF